MLLYCGYFLIIFVILAFVCALFQVSWAPSSLSLLTNVLSTEIPVAVHRSVVCVRGQRLAFTKRPRRFQLTAAVALAMCGWRLDTCYTASHLLNPSLLLPKPCTGTAQGQSTRHTHTLVLPHFPPLTSFPVKSGFCMGVKTSFTWGKTRVQCQHDIPICCHGNLETWWQTWKQRQENKGIIINHLYFKNLAWRECVVENLRNERQK